MPAYSLRPEADQDLEQIRRHIAEDNPDAALRLLQQFRDTFRNLADFPMMGTARDELGNELRSLPVGNYLIFYRPVSDGADISRVLHGSLDITSDYFNA